MDRELVDKMERLGKRGGKDLEVSVTFEQETGGDAIALSGPKGQETHTLKLLGELYASERDKPASPSGPSGEEHMGLLMAIETAIGSYYREHPELKDWDVIRALKQINRKPESVPKDPLPLRIQLNLRLQLSLEDYTRREVRWALRKVLRSVERHHNLAGTRGYLDFIVDFV